MSYIMSIIFSLINSIQGCIHESFANENVGCSHYQHIYTTLAYIVLKLFDCTTFKNN